MHVKVPAKHLRQSFWQKMIKVRLKVINYFCKKIAALDAWQGPKYYTSRWK